MSNKSSNILYRIKTLFLQKTYKCVWKNKHASVKFIYMSKNISHLLYSFLISSVIFCKFSLIYFTFIPFYNKFQFQVVIVIVFISHFPIWVGIFFLLFWRKCVFVLSLSTRILFSSSPKTSSVPEIFLFYPFILKQNFCVEFRNKIRYMSLELYVGSRENVHMTVFLLIIFSIVENIFKDASD